MVTDYTSGYGANTEEMLRADLLRVLSAGYVSPEPTAMAASASVENQPEPKTTADDRPEGFHLCQRGLGSGGVRYTVDGYCVVRPHEVVVRINAGHVVANETVVLHYLRVGVCGYADGHKVDVFARDIPLKETRLAAGDSYTLHAKTIRIPFAKAPPAMNCLCSVLSGSGGDAIAEALGSVSIPADLTTPPFHQTTLASKQTTQKDDEFWKSTNPADWSDKETQDFLTKSPWVHYYGHVLAPSDVVGPRGQHALVPAPDIAIRWESATMVRGALARVESKEYKDALARFSKDYYVIAVIHMTMGVGQEGLSSQWSREQEEAMQNPSTTQVGQGGARMAQTDNLEARRVFTSSRLLIPGGEAVSPVPGGVWKKRGRHGQPAYVPTQSGQRQKLWVRRPEDHVLGRHGFLHR